MDEHGSARLVGAGSKSVFIRNSFVTRLDRIPSIAASWRRNWEEIIPMFAFPPEIRRLIYTTNAIESLNRGLRKIIKTRGHFPNDQAAAKLLFLALRNIEKRWKAAPKEWLPALNQFDILFGERLRLTN